MIWKISFSLKEKCSFQTFFFWILRFCLLPVFFSLLIIPWTPPSLFSFIFDRVGNDFLNFCIRQYLNRTSFLVPRKFDIREEKRASWRTILIQIHYVRRLPKTSSDAESCQTYFFVTLFLECVFVSLQEVLSVRPTICLFVHPLPLRENCQNRWFEPK